MPHPEHAVEDLTGAGTDGLGFFTSLSESGLRMSPLPLFRRVAIAEAVTWALLLTGMFLKYVTETTELGVRIFGMVHGVVVRRLLPDHRAGRRRPALVARPDAARAGRVGPAVLHGALRPVRREARRAGDDLAADQRAVRSRSSVRSWLLRNPVRGALAGLVAVAALTGVALLVGPPA